MSRLDDEDGGENETGLVQGEIDGPRVCYCINNAAMAKLKKLVAEL